MKEKLCVPACKQRRYMRVCRCVAVDRVSSWNLCCRQRIGLLSWAFVDTKIKLTSEKLDLPFEKLVYCHVILCDTISLIYSSACCISLLQALHFVPFVFENRSFFSSSLSPLLSSQLGVKNLSYREYLHLNLNVVIKKANLLYDYKSLFL